MPRLPTEVERQETLDIVRRDVRSSSAAAPAASCWRTWVDFHHRRHGPDSCLPPLTMQSIEVVAAQMKKAGYHSDPNYLAVAKRMNLRPQMELGIHPATWTQQLELIGRDMTRCLARGLGPARA